MNNILIIHHYSEQELRDHSFGGTRLIWKQKQFFESLSNCKVKILSLQDLDSFSSNILGYSSTFRNKKVMSYVRQDSEKRWLLNLIFGFFIHYIIKFDFLWRRAALDFVKTCKPDSILCNDPIYAGVISEISNSQNVSCILYEHNIWWLFYDQLLNSRMKYKPLILLMKYMELNAIKKSNSVICMSNEDKKILVQRKIPSEKISVWVPFETVSSKKKSKEIPIRLKRQLEERFVVGFVGANFEPNVVSVENIIQIARNSENKNVVFLILGKVCDAFKNRKNLPVTVIFKGFVSDLDPYLSLCDAFINPKTVCDTGIEIKMFDYLKFNKPIITTKIGSRGFETFSNVLIINELNEVNKKFWERLGR